MEERNSLAQKMMFWDYLVVGALAFVSVKVDYENLPILANSIMVLIFVGFVILFCQTYLLKSSDLHHGIVFSTIYELLSVGIVIYFSEPVIIHLLLVLIFITISIYRNFKLCEITLIETMGVYLLYFFLVKKEFVKMDVSMLRMVIGAIGVIVAGIVLASIIGTEEKNRRVIKENRKTSLDMLKLVEMKKEEAEHMADVKSTFLANMSHEIRTPIHAILGMNELILREGTQKEILDYAYNIESAGKSLLAIINDVLDISKIESGKTEIFSKEYNVVSALYNFNEMASIKAKEKGLYVHFEIAENIPSRMYGDEFRIKQIFTNILNNAIKYTHEGGITLTLSGEEIGEDKIHTIAAISDTGIGIKQEDIEKIFDAFQRVDMQKNQSIEGTGLGMSITKQLVELMDGKIYVESEYGKGSTFYVELVQGIVDRTPIGKMNQTLTQTQEIKKHRKAEFAAPRAKILVVDDNQMNLTVVKGLLKRTEMQVDLAQSGYEALEAVKHKVYDMILMDHMMPEMDGIETLNQIKVLEANPNRETPILVLTANATIGSKEMYLKKGFDDYLSKPIEASALEKMIKKYLPIELVFEAKTEEVDVMRTGEIQLFKNQLRPFGIDLQKGLSYVEENIEQYKELAALFLKKSTLRNERLKEFLEAEDLKNYTIEVHALKSDGKLLGSNILADMAADMEKKSKEGNLTYLKKHEKQLELLLKKTENGLHILMEETEQKTEEKQLAGQSIGNDKYQEELKLLMQSIAQYDIDKTTKILDRLSTYQLKEEQEKLLKKVTEQIGEFSYEKALNILKADFTEEACL